MKIIFLFSIYFSFVLCGKIYPQKREGKMHFETGIGSKISYFEWSIAGNLDGESPNILSELKFNSVTSIGYYAKGNYSPLRHLKMSVLIQKNNVISGKGTDIDYKDDNRTNPIFEKKFISNKGSYTFIKGGVGIPVFNTNKFKIIPSLFYHMTKQKFYLLSHDIQDLRSTYETNIHGTKISLENRMDFNATLFSSITVGYQLVRYKAEANWNLIDIFMHPVSFSQTSKGYGYSIDLTFGYNINKMFSIIIEGELNTITIGKGIDTSYLTTGEEISTQFNGAKNNLFGSKIGIRASF